MMSQRRAELSMCGARPKGAGPFLGLCRCVAVSPFAVARECWNPGQNDPLLRITSVSGQALL